MIIKLGERVLFDGEVLLGFFIIDIKILIGEFVFVNVIKGEMVFFGCININGLLIVKVIKFVSELIVFKVFEMVENVISKKVLIENFIIKFVWVYILIVILLVVLIVVILLFVI